MPNIVQYRLPQDSNLHIIAIEAGPVMTWCYLCVDEKNKCAVLFDAPFGSMAIIDEIIEEHGYMLEGLYLTHSHWDHTAEAALLKQKHDIPVYIHPDDNYRLVSPMEHTLWELPFEIQSIENAQFLRMDDKVRCGKWLFSMRHVPGHTEGSVCFYDAQAHILIAGDTLFAGSIGRTDLPGGNHQLLLTSLREQVLTLDDATVVLSGHGEATTIGHERLNNPYIGQQATQFFDEM
jgi:glyoxylase-like metal-dependent hydrolase (beta-lactamase superfamily II)